MTERKNWLGKNPEGLSLARQCELCGLSRSSYYYEPQPEDELNLTLMRLLDEQYTQTPFFGVRKMTAWLQTEGYVVNHKRVWRLMQKLGIMAVYPCAKRKKGAIPAIKYPYLLRGLTISHPNQVWSTDITYIRLLRGFLYLVALMDWFSRYVISWELSNSLDYLFCPQALDQALEQAKPEIFNSDRGAQFTCEPFLRRLTEETIKISMDGRGRALDNIFVERLWRSLNYEEVYLKDYETVEDAYSGIAAYFDFYNRKRPHQALKYRTPYELYYGEKPASKEKEES